MKGLLKFILSHSIFISGCAAALSFQTLQLVSIPISYYRLGFIFFATLAGYNAYWIVSKWSFNSHMALLPFLLKNKRSFIIILVALTGILFCITRIQLVMYNAIITFILLAIYAIPVLPFPQLHFARKAGFLKTIVLAFAWTIVTVLIPLQVSMVELEQPALLVFINRFLFMLMLCIIFDKRDASIDKIRGLQSLATEMKPLLLHYLIGIVFIAYMAVCLLLHFYVLQFPPVAGLLVTGGITLVFYIASNKKRGYLFYYFGVDGLMFLSAVLTGVAGLFRG